MPIVQTPPPVAEQVSPVPAQTAYERGVAARRAGRAGEAAALLAEAVRARPDDVDARLNLGLALIALDRVEEAERELTLVVQAAPNYADAHLALARAASRRGDREAVERHLARVQALDPRNPEIARLRQDDETSQDAWRADVRLARSDLSAGLDPWDEASVAVARRIDPRTTLAASAEMTRRFGRRDVYVEVLASRRFGWGGGYLAGGGAPDADHRAELALRVGLEVPIGHGVAGTLDASLSRFPVGTITSVQPGLLWSSADGGLVASARWINTWDEADTRRDGYALSASARLTTRLVLRAGYADAPETSEGVATPVVARSLGFDVMVAQGVVFRATAVQEDRGAYDRREVSLGLGWRF